MKDYTGNKKSLFVTLGASAGIERAEQDYYATDPAMASELCKYEELVNVWECACGGGHLAKVFERYGLLGRASDLGNRGYGESGVDFLAQTETWDGDIVTNPPYKYAQRFIEHALDLIPEGRKVCMFLKLTFLEGQSRVSLFRNSPPRTLYVSVKRVQCAKNGDFTAYSAASPAAAYAWYVWQKGFAGRPSIQWMNYNRNSEVYPV